MSATCWLRAQVAWNQDPLSDFLTNGIDGYPGYSMRKQLDQSNDMLLQIITVTN